MWKRRLIYISRRWMSSASGCLPSVTDSRAVMLTPVVVLLHSRYTDFRLLFDEVTEAFYLDLKQFLYARNNYRMLEVGDHFVIHHFDLGKYQISGLTAFELITIAALVYQQVPEFPFFRHGEQLKKHFQLCVTYGNKSRSM